MTYNNKTTTTTKKLILPDDFQKSKNRSISNHLMLQSSLYMCECVEQENNYKLCNFIHIFIKLKNNKNEKKVLLT